MQKWLLLVIFPLVGCAKKPATHTLETDRTLLPLSNCEEESDFYDECLDDLPEADDSPYFTDEE